MKRELLINERKLKDIVSKTLDTKYENISIEWNDEPELIIELRHGHFIENISFSDERILKEFNFKELNMEFDYITIYENEYAYKVDATDEQRVYIFYCNELVIDSNIA